MHDASSRAAKFVIAILEIHLGSRLQRKCFDFPLRSTRQSRCLGLGAGSPAVGGFSLAGSEAMAPVVTELASHHSTHVDEATAQEVVRANRACEGEIFTG